MIKTSIMKMIPQGSKGHAEVRTLHSVSTGSQDLRGGFYEDSFGDVEFLLDFCCILLYFCWIFSVFDIGDNDDIHQAGGGRVASERLPLPTFSCEHHIHQVNDYDEYDCYDDYDDNDDYAVRASGGGRQYICETFYTTRFSEQKFYTLKVRKSH